MSSADTYTHGHHDAVLRSHRSRTADNSARYLLPQLRAGTELLDVGCGPGTLTADLAARVAPGEVTGIDLAPAVVEAARAFTRERAVANVTFRDGDFRALTEESQRFDVVHAHQVLQHLSDPVGALRAMAQLARPTGVIAARDSDYPAMFWAPADPWLDRWLEIYLAVAGKNGGDPAAGRHLLRFAREAGLRDVTYSTSSWTYTSDTDIHWWSDLWADRISSSGSALAQQAVAYGVASEGELEAVAGGLRAWAERADTVFVVPHGEILARPRASG